MIKAIDPLCSSRHNKAKFILKENKSHVKFSNDSGKEIIEVVVDGCVISNGIRCDFLVDIRESNLSILVELKGCDIKHAMKQLESTHKALGLILRSNVKWIISSTRCPISSSDIQISKIRARKEYGVVLLIKNSPIDYVI